MPMLRRAFLPCVAGLLLLVLAVFAFSRISSLPRFSYGVEAAGANGFAAPANAAPQDRKSVV
jgi:hypothetical protein